METEIDTEYQRDKIVCPHCGDTIEDEHWTYETNEVIECGNCKKKFIITEKTYEAYYSTEKYIEKQGGRHSAHGLPLPAKGGKNETN